MGNSCKGSSNKRSIAIPTRVIQIETNPTQLKGLGNFGLNSPNEPSIHHINNTKPPPSEAQITGEPEEEIKSNLVSRPLEIKYDIEELGIGEYYLSKEFIDLKNKSGKLKTKEKDNPDVAWDRAVVQMRGQRNLNPYNSILYNQTDACLREYSVLKPNSFIRMLQNGPPMRYRWSVWKNFLQPDQFFIEDLYEKLINLSSPHEYEMKKDVARTFPREPYFSSERFNNIGQNQLFNVLKALSLYFPNVGYTLSMNFIAAFMLLVNGGNELEAFWAFVALARGNKFLLMGFFEKDFPLLKFYLFLFYEMLEVEMPKLCEHIKSVHIIDEAWIFQWFMSLFLYSFPPKQVVRVWDFIMVEGLLGIIKVSLGLLKVFEKDLMLLDDMGMTSLFEYLKNECNRAANLSSGGTNSQIMSNPNQSLNNHVQSRVIAQNASNQSYLHTNQSHIQNQSINNLQVPASQNNINININSTQRDNVHVVSSVQNRSSELTFHVKELDINEALGHAENFVITVEKLLYYVDLYPEKMDINFPEPYGQFFKNVHLYQTDPKKLIEFQKEVDFHLLKSELCNKPNEEIVICNLLDENTLILKDLNL